MERGLWGEGGREGGQGFGCMGFVSCVGPIASHLLFMFHFFQCETSPELL